MTEHSHPVVFNKQHALARVGGLEDVLRDVMTLMTTESPKIHAEISASFQRGDLVGLKRSAHTLKGSVGLVGATDLVRRLRRIEDSASLGDTVDLPAEFIEIDRQFAELQQILHTELAT